MKVTYNMYSGSLSFRLLTLKWYLLCHFVAWNYHYIHCYALGWVHDALRAIVLPSVLRVLASTGWREVWRPSPQGASRSLQWSETGMEDPKRGHCSGSPVSEMTYTGSSGTLNSTISYHTRKRTPWQCTASVCVAGVHCWGISLG